MPPKPSAGGSSHSSHHHAKVGTAPMPAADEVEKRFAEIARNANLSEQQIKQMGLNEKWHLVQNFALASKSEGQAAKAEYWVTKLRAEPSTEVVKQLTFHIGSKVHFAGFGLSSHLQGVNWLE